jgi:hypothetical protein
MTVRDMFDQGITLQGNIRIQRWNNNIEDYDLDYEAWNSDLVGVRRDIPRKLLDTEISFIYPTIQYYNERKVPQVVIEVRNED